MGSQCGRAATQLARLAPAGLCHTSKTAVRKAGVKRGGTVNEFSQGKRVQALTVSSHPSAVWASFGQQSSSNPPHTTKTSPANTIQPVTTIMASKMFQPAGGRKRGVRWLQAVCPPGRQSAPAPAVCSSVMAAGIAPSASEWVPTVAAATHAPTTAQVRVWCEQQALGQDLDASLAGAA